MGLRPNDGSRNFSGLFLAFVALQIGGSSTKAAKPKYYQKSNRIKIGGSLSRAITIFTWIRPRRRLTTPATRPARALAAFIARQSLTCEKKFQPCSPLQFGPPPANGVLLAAKPGG